MEYIIIFFGLITFITMILGAINALVWKDETADSILDIIVHICAGITGGFTLCLLYGQNHIINETEYKEYKELKKQYMQSPNLFNANNQTCWNINGAKHCGDFTYEDNKSKIEVKNGSTNITIK
jgi:hypothetical protein